MTLGEKLLKLRKAQGWSQEELAGRIGVSRQALSRWEAGNAMPDVERVVLLSDLFGVSTDYLLRKDWTQDAPVVQPEQKQTERRIVSWIVTGVGAAGILTTFILGFALEPYFSCARLARWWNVWEDRNLLWAPILSWLLFLFGISEVKNWDLAELIDGVRKEASLKKIRQDLGLDKEERK